jgi:GNAT superfamily N-acetyltransferase
LTELFVRRPTLDDLDAVVELGNAFERVFSGAESFTRADVADDRRRLDLDYGMGWIRWLFVRRPWRRQGLGMALLQNAFRQFHVRGQRKVGLGVDAESPTGATRLYERAGMRVVEETVVYRKELA